MGIQQSATPLGTPIGSSTFRSLETALQAKAGAGDEARTRDVLLGKKDACRGNCHTFRVTLDQLLPVPVLAEPRVAVTREVGGEARESTRIATGPQVKSEGQADSRGGQNPSP